ncbi:MAG: SLC13 family permease, partial [Desulfobacterales bacterium]|nr:SLC13 family permease [Desulfobacterales bacterium]
MTPDIVFTFDMFIVMTLLVVVIALFIFEWVRVDVVGLMMMVLLPLTGVIDAHDAIGGLGSNAVVAIIAVIIIGAGLDKTGVMTQLSRQIIRLAGKSRNRIMILLSATVAIISSFMQNIGAISLFLPAASRISKQLKIPMSGLLMPMGFLAIIGGCLTLVGSSPLILLNDLMEVWCKSNAAAMGGKTFQPFGLFDVAPIGLALVVAGLLYFLVFGKLVLPAVQDNDGEGFMSSYLDAVYGKRIGKIFELT